MTLTPGPADWRDRWIYFLLVDRFDNPTMPPAGPWDEPFYTFQGGSLDGVAARLDYVKSLGAGAVWLSPVLQNPAWDDTAYHGYGIQHFARVEPRFCADPDRARTHPDYADAQLRAVVDAAHARGLAVIFDIVLNHAGDVFGYDDFGSSAPWRDSPEYPVHWRNADGTANPEWAQAPTSGPPDAGIGPVGLARNDAFRRLGNAFDAPGHDPVSAGDFYTLKEMVTGGQDPDGRFPVRDVLIDCYADIIRRFDIDGFRIDTLMYIERDFAQTFGNAMREYAESMGKSNFFSYGEVWSDENHISAFVGRHATDTGDLVGVDAALDFPLFYLLPGLAKGSVPPQALVDMYANRKDLENGVISSHGDATGYFVTFADNHDQLSRLRYVDPDDPDRFDAQVGLALGLLFTLPGIPCVYYGTESGYTGSGEHPEAVRQAMWGAPGAFDLTLQPFAATLTQLTATRDARPGLKYGRHYFRPVSGNGADFGHSPFAGGVAAYSRILAAGETLVVANCSPSDTFTGRVLVDTFLTPAGQPLVVVWSNLPGPAEPKPARCHDAGSVTVTDGRTVSTGPITSVGVTLRPMEIQILGPTS